MLSEINKVKLQAKLQPHLDQEKQKKEEAQIARDCLRHGLCPKCGEKMPYKKLPRGQWMDDDLVFYGVWTCEPCKVKVDTLRRTELINKCDSLLLMWLHGETNR